ncbi:pentapeptide repeat-containing protein [Archangium sp.]|uniref:pentapeptide repeat-containing protein n=1 Tax=Archangium sp. TaxID=1872627 RepID=UPI002D2F8E50|nr:pentapeptide repeat-containing protein [Archangium sp.]HYO53861.1 pentapeptide repeat-containing protein [Archangium sp.]
MNIIYEDRVIEGERLALTDKEGNYYLGPNLTLRRCTVVTRVSARWLHILPTHFIDCTIEVKQELKNFPWVRASLKGCRFKGRMTSCDFGPWRDYTEGWEHGAVEDCDFTEARLSNCRFHGCDMRTLRLPPWPCFTILDPIGRLRELNSVEWPEQFGSIIIENFYKHPPSTVALTYHAPTVAKRYETTEEELKAVIEKFDCIVY